MSANLARLREILAEVTDLGRAAMVLEWDQETYMPPGGVEGRAQQMSTLLRLAHVKFTDDEVGALLDKLDREFEHADFESDEASIVRVTRRDYDQARKLAADLVAEIAHAGAVTQPLWRKAREHADWKLFAPYFEKVVDLNKRVADALGYEDSPYDALIDRTEPGMSTSQLTAIFEQLKQAIVPLVAEIARHQDAID